MIIPSPLSSSSLGAGAVALLYTGIAALWILGSGALLGYSIQDPVLQLRLELAKGLGFVAVTGALLYLLLSRWRRTSTADSVASPVVAANSRWMILPFLGMALTVPLIASVIIAVHGPELERRAYSDLQSVAELKVGQVENWLAERQADAVLLATDRLFTAAVAAFI